MESICRLCAQQSSLLVPVFSLVNEHLLADLITVICPIRIDVSDRLPKQICEGCREIIVSANRMRLMSVESDANFRDGNLFLPWSSAAHDDSIGNAKDCESNDGIDIAPKAEKVEPNKFYKHVTNWQYRPKRKTIQSEHTCAHCAKPFSSLSAFIKHMRGIHGQFYYRPYKCSLCGFSQWTRSRIERHQDLHHSRSAIEYPQFCCDLCPKQAKHKAELELHMIELHTRNRIRASQSYTLKYPKETKRVTVQCPYCAYYTVHPSNYRRHMKMIHNSTVWLKNSGLFQKVEDEEFRESLLCDQCSLSFDTSRALRKHMRQYHESHDEVNRFICHICSKAFRINSLLVKHEKTHAEDSYKCYACPSTFKFPENLRLHEQVHDPTHFSKFQCDRCPKSYAVMRSLKNHILTFHLKKEKLRNHACSYCGMKFHRNYNLQRHIMTHTGEVSIRLVRLDK